MRHRRPFGVIVIALMQAIAAPTAGISLVLTDTPLGVSLIYERYSEIVGTVFGVLGIVIAIGLWRLHRWAWVATMLWFGTTMAGALLAYRVGDPHYPLMVVSILTVFYLNQRDVQVAFRAAPPSRQDEEDDEEWRGTAPHTATIRPHE